MLNQGYGTSFLDLLCCAFGGVIILMVVFLQSSGALQVTNDTEVSPTARDLELPYEGEAMLVLLECVLPVGSTYSGPPPRIAWEIHYPDAGGTTQSYRSGEGLNRPTWMDTNSSHEWSGTSATLVFPDARKVPADSRLEVYLADRGDVPEGHAINLRWTLKSPGPRGHALHEPRVAEGPKWITGPVIISLSPL